MKKFFSLFIFPCCVVLMLVPFFVSSVGAAAEEAEEVEVSVSVLQLDASSSDTQTQAASTTDIVLDIPACTSGLSIKVNNTTVSGKTLNWKEGEDITFVVSCSQPCVLFYEQEDSDIIPVTPVKQSDGSYAFTVCAMPEMKVYFSIKGDADLSGAVDTTDVAAVESIILSGKQPSGAALLYIDTNGDGKIDTKDLTALKAECLGIRDLSW